jgi:methylglutamate dehydrogenase subunit D
MTTMTDETLTAQSAFAGLALASAADRGVRVAARDELAIATVLVRNGCLAQLTQRLQERFGIELPHGPRRAAVGAVALAGTGPHAWLATSEEHGHGFGRLLKETVGDAASVADQSSGYAILRMTGPKLREALAKILPLDLHPRGFVPGDVASTIASHVGATLWRLEDTDDCPVFEIAVFRSLAGSLWHTLTDSAAEFGFVSERAIP